MALRKFVACTLSSAALVAAAGCADGTGQALTPTLPSVESATNSDGTRLKAQPPQGSSPRASVRVSNLTPLLVAQNTSGQFDSSASLAYQFEVYQGGTTTLLVQSDPIAVGSDGTTGWSIPTNTLKLNSSYDWRVRALYNGVPGTWSGANTFRTPLPPPVDGPVACGSSSGQAIIGCVGRAYPKYLEKTAAGDHSLERRHRNMEFIRDRIIETGICKGLNLGRNFKRGTPVISHDFIVWRSDRDRGVDIASGYDDVNTVLKLTWQVFGADKSYGHPFYAGYPQVDCSTLADPNQALE
jgi:hypothetical protein